MNELEQLEEAKDAAWREYDKLLDAAWREYDKLLAQAEAAYKKFDAAAKAYKEAVLYEKAKRKVIRDLINAAGKKVA